MEAIRTQLTTVALTERATMLLSICAAVLAGLLFVVEPALVVVPALVLPALPLVTSPLARIVFVVFGGLLVFQSSDELTPAKLLFLVGAAVAVAAAFARTQRLSQDSGAREVEPLLKASVAMFALIGVSLPVSMANDTPFTSWLRDASPYVLFAVAPLLALDAYSGLSASTLRRLLIVAGFAGSLAFTAEWLSPRGIVTLPDVIGLPTLLLGAALFSYAFAVVLEGERRRLAWLALASVIMAGFLSTGTRSSLVLMIAPLAIVVGTRERLGRRSVRLFIVVPAAVLLVVVGLQTVVRSTGADRDVLSARAELVYSSGGTADLSFIERRSQSRASWELFKESPFVGAGPGHAITWVDSSGTTISASTVDSPLGYLAKFGLLGLVPLAVLIWAFLSSLARMRARTGSPTIAQLSLIGFAGVVAAWSLLYVPFEDKGITSGFLLLLALALSESSARDRALTADARA